MAKRHKGTVRTERECVGYGYVGRWMDGTIGWFMPRHLGGNPEAEPPPEDPNCAGELFELCRITVEVIPGVRRRRAPGKTGPENGGRS